MYGQGSFGPPTAQSPYTSSSMFHQQNPAVSLPPFTQGSQPPRTTFLQHGRPPFPSPVAQLGHASYEHTPVPQQLGPPLAVPSSGVNSRPYSNPAPPPLPTQPLKVHANSQIPQNSQWLQNANFVQQTVPSVAPMVLPPPHSQGQTVYSSPLQQPPSSGVQAHPQAHEPASSFFISTQVGAFREPKNSNMLVARPPPLPPPPPPTSPPVALPHPPSSPPPTSSFLFLNNDTPRPNPTGSYSTSHAQNCSRINTPVGFTDGVSNSSLGGTDTCKPDGFGKGNCHGDSTSKISSSCMKNSIFDLPPPPPKPVDDRTVRSIQILCQFIAKNGPEFEDMTRKKEFGNPQFKFLFGGEPGSENSVAYEYFIWMKKKCHMEFKSTGAQQTTDSPVRPLEGYSSHLNADTGVPSSSADSDMDMEDDITHPNEELLIHPSNNVNNDTVSVSSHFGMKHMLTSSQEHSLGHDTMVGNSFVPDALIEQRQDQNQSIIRKSAAKADGSVVDASGNVESPLDDKMQISFSPSKTNLVKRCSEEHPDQLVKGASPFRLLQDYASEGCSDDEAHDEDVMPSTAVLANEVHSRIGDKNNKDNFGADLGPKSLLASNKESNLVSECQDFSLKSQDVTSTTGKSKFVVDVYNDQGLIEDRVSHGPLCKENALTDANVEAASICKKDAMSVSTKVKVDKFGRLIREGASDSDSDGSPHYTGRRGKRDRSRSRSRSPHDRRRRRRRSPRGRKERHGRSRSFSPRRHTSRSKSPLYRNDYTGDKMRKDKGLLPECFDFRRGKCYRGASCRYLHHVEKHERSRSNRNKPSLQELARSSRRSDLNEKNENDPEQKSYRQHDEGRVQGLKPSEDMPGVEKKTLSELATHPSDVGGHLEPGILKSPVADPGRHHVIPSSVGKLEEEQSQGHYTDQVFLNLDQQHGRMDKSSESSPMETSVAIPNQIPGEKPQLNKGPIIDPTLTNVNKPENIPFQSIASHQSNVPAANNIFHLPPSSCPLPFNEMAASYSQQVSSASNSASVENYPAYQAPISYPHSQFPIPSNPTWNSLPPPPAHSHFSQHFSVNDMVGTSSTHGEYSDRPVHFQQNILPPRNQFLAQTSTDPYITEFAAGSHVGQNQTYPSLQEAVRRSHPLDDHQPRTFPTSQKISKLHGGVDVVGKDCSIERPLLGSYPLNSLMADSLHSQALPFSGDSRESPSKRIPPGEFSNHPIRVILTQQPSYDLQYSAGDSVSSVPGDDGKVISTMSRYMSGLFDRNQPSQFADFGGSRISSHYNPYTSTFEQPLNSKFSSNIITPEKDRPYGSHFGAAYSFRHVPGDGRAVSLGSNTISPQNIVEGTQGTFPRPIGDQYDPLYDSIEPSSNSFKISCHNYEATDESDIMVRMSGSNKPLDVEDNNKQKEGAIALTTSPEDEEYGETADAEVGAVEDGSPSNPNDAEDTAAGEVEIDQVMAPGKNKKESRSIKLFKVALANFVKEVLKPSWRQGNMSKEAFKTIVKKTVDKVSGAMKSHQIPKSQAKINHYIDSSQRKLTKLVMGYVDKYVKV